MFEGFCDLSASGLKRMLLQDNAVNEQMPSQSSVVSDSKFHSSILQVSFFGFSTQLNVNVDSVPSLTHTELK